MFMLKKIVQPLILPPGNLILLVLIGAVWMFVRKRTLNGFLLSGLAILMWCLSIPPTADLLLQGLEQRHRLPGKLQGDVIVMLGGAVFGGAADVTGEGAPTPESCERILTAARLYRQTKLPVILSGGRVLDHHPLMGKIYKRMLVDLGIPEAAIILENRSRDTMENAHYTAALCRQKNFRQPIVITHAAHMPRAAYSFRCAGLAMTPFPCGFRTWPGKTYHWPDFLPRGYGDIALALHEYIGLFFYRWSLGDCDNYHSGTGN